MISLIAAIFVSFAASLALETSPPTAKAMRAAARLPLFRVAIHLILFAVAFSVSWRPWHAALVVTIATGLFGLGSAVKRSILGEPLVFTDAALVRLAIRHPRLYYAERLAEPRALAGMATLTVATVAWFALEPVIFPEGGVALLALPPLIAAGLLAGLMSRPAARFALAQVDMPPDAERDVARFGLVATLALHALAWRAAERPSAAAQTAAAALPAPGLARRGPKLVVAIQCESFVDIGARGLAGPRLPAFARLCGEAVAWGRCPVPAEGAYTMRSEFGFLTGLPPETLGLDGFDPFLTAEPYAARALPRLFAASGRRTTVVHPYDRRFFERDRVMPLLGFERFVDGSAFAGAERFGPYVSDAAVADWLVAEIESVREPAFLFAITIENHGPWGPGRLPETADPAAQYARHLTNADRMIGRVAAALAACEGGGALCLYGDHAPARGLHPGLPDRCATDYLLWDSRRPGGHTAARPMSVDALAREFAARV